MSDSSVKKLITTEFKIKSKIFLKSKFCKKKERRNIIKYNFRFKLMQLGRNKFSWCDEWHLLIAKVSKCNFPPFDIKQYLSLPLQELPEATIKDF